MGDSTIVLNPDIRIRLSSEELYRRFLAVPQTELFALSRGSYENLARGYGPDNVHMFIYRHHNQISFNGCAYNSQRIIYPLTSNLLIIQRFEELLTKWILVDAPGYRTASEKHEKLRYYRKTNGYPDLLYSNKLETVMRNYHQTRLLPMFLTGEIPHGCLIDPLTLNFTVEGSGYRLTGIEIIVDLNDRNGRAIISYELQTYAITGFIQAELIESEVDLEQLISGYLKMGYLYVDDFDLIQGYTVEEMRDRIASFREQTERVKL